MKRERLTVNTEGLKGCLIWWWSNIGGLGIVEKPAATHAVLQHRLVLSNMEFKDQYNVIIMSNKGGNEDLKINVVVSLLFLENMYPATCTAPTHPPDDKSAWQPNISWSISLPLFGDSYHCRACWCSPATKTNEIFALSTLYKITAQINRGMTHFGDDYVLIAVGRQRQGAQQRNANGQRHGRKDLALHFVSLKLTNRKLRN